MSNPADSSGTRQILTLTQLQPALIELRLTSPQVESSATKSPRVVEPMWSVAIELIVQAAFAGRDVCFIALEPRLEWRDLDLEDVSRRIKTVQCDNISCTLAFAERVSRDELAEVARSQDFRHGGLLIATLQEQPGQRITDFLDALSQASRRFPAWKEWIHLPPDEVTSILHEQTNAKISSNEEFMECVDDGERVYWFHPRLEALTVCIEALQAATIEHDWRVEIHRS